ncbi:unnamed protein product [Paramecium octaurelia]|uniref:Uncharacterized protein n=1 Tax=Paramecium octaurelia TaxID=43137 RepID=A0A8S1TSM7_PAROT|nr:unnamed protein product [Paramecium octaurelia]
MIQKDYDKKLKVLEIKAFQNLNRHKEHQKIEKILTFIW